MSKGGGRQTTNQQQTSQTTPWGTAAPYIDSIFPQAQQLMQQGQGYYPGQTTVGPTQAEGAAWGQLNNYNQQTFGNQPVLKYGDISGALSGALSGGASGDLAGSIAPQAQQQIGSAFNGPQSVGRYGFDTTLNPNASAPQFGRAGALDATGAYQSMLSGQPDYQGVQGAIDAANAPILRQFQQDILPSLNNRATFTNNETGGIKSLNRVLPEIGQRMSENAQSITEGERQRALAAQQSAAQQIAQGGLQSYGLGLQTAQGQAGLQQALAGQNLATDQSNAGLAGQYRGDVLGLGGLASTLTGQQGSQTLGALNQAGSIYDLGRTPANDASAYAGYDRSLQEQQIAADQARYDYNRDQPFNTLGWYANLVNGTALPYATTNSTGTNTQRNSSWNVNAGDIAKLGLALFSDRRLKTDITRVGSTDAGLPLYRYRMKGERHFQIGVMADEAAQVFPDAVMRGPDGFLRVNYGDIR